MIAHLHRLEGQHFKTMEVQGRPDKLTIPVLRSSPVASFRTEETPMPEVLYDELIFELKSWLLDESEAEYVERLQFRGNYKSPGI